MPRQSTTFTVPSARNNGTRITHDNVLQCKIPQLQAYVRPTEQLNMEEQLFALKTASPDKTIDEMNEKS
ncbi:hypothetical protein TNCV_3018271 [Trichonephila clavipes]|nr:hypothetical protein TNCV_3018271 [Trichonephila clavipes]